MLERFSDRARKVLHLANQEALRKNHEYVGTEHVLIALTREDGIASSILRNLNIDYCKINEEVGKLVQSGPDRAIMGKLPQTPRTKKVIEYAYEESRKLGHNYVGTEHLLLGLMAEKGGVAHQVLENLGVDIKTVYKKIEDMLGPVDHEPCFSLQHHEPINTVSEFDKPNVSLALSKIKPLLQQIIDILTEEGL